jgi:hypothetical protein
MPINQNHLFEELDGVKCSIVEKNASPARVEFLRTLLEYNGYKVVVAATPPPKAAPAKPAPKPALLLLMDQRLQQHQHPFQLRMQRHHLQSQKHLQLVLPI